MTDSPIYGVAIIGMAGRWPGAGNVAQFWRNMRDGVECISRFPASQLEVAGAEALARQSNYVRARSILDDPDMFDAEFFGILPREAELLDPQHRVFLECCWEALEDAGYDPFTYSGAIGVHAGCSTNTYFLRNVCADRSDIEQFTSTYPLAGFPTLLGAIADTLATRVSYKLNLRGPSYTIQSACSTSLVAVSQACQGLLSYQCDMVLAGGITITFPQKRGYHFQDGGMGSADGRCRPFEANATGTVFGNGAGVVLLKRLDDAIADGDHIYAVIRGSAVNNDGSVKAGFTAPGVDGQASVIALAQELADVAPETIGYLESHGTGTPLGDPIEFAALERAFGSKAGVKKYCALGGVKRNVGHLEMAAGVTGLVCAAQALKHRQLPPALGFEDVNKHINMADSPFYINKEPKSWDRGSTPRRAGVSAFGVGGTNAHVVLEEAPELAKVEDTRPGHLLVLSARTSAALDSATENLKKWLSEESSVNLGSVAFTLQAGRRVFPHRRVLACSTIDDAVQTLNRRDKTRVFDRVHDGQDAVPVFMFPGQGSQAVNMTAELYSSLPEFRNDIDECAAILAPHLGLNLCDLLYRNNDSAAADRSDLTDTRLAQPALFATEYALAKLWMRWGVHPQAMIGHSVGELVAACLAGVFELEDALAIVAARGRMMQELPAGQMLSVQLSADDVRPLLNGELSLAAINAPRLSVVSGPEAAISALETHLETKGVMAKRLKTSHAFHSRMVNPIVEPFAEFVGQFQLGTPKIPFVSCVTGTWITAEEATNPRYWGQHIREPVRFSSGIEALQRLPKSLLLEVGPGRVLTTLANQHRDSRPNQAVITSLPGTTKSQSEYQSLLHAAGQLWLNGVAITWSQLHEPGVRRCSLPTYPFQRQRYWIDTTTAKPPEDVRPPADSRSNGDVPNVTQEWDRPMSNPTPTIDRLPPRVERIRSKLSDVFSTFSGVNLEADQHSTSFLELGFDSLFLTQITQAVQSKFGIRVTFRQLLEQHSTIEALSNFIDSQLPADALPATPIPGPTVAAPMISQETNSPCGAITSSTIETIVREQFQAFSQMMSKQIELLRGVVPVNQGPIPTPAPASISPNVDLVPTPKTSEFKAFGPYKPPQRGPVGGLTQKQQEYLNAFIERYTAKTKRSKEFTQSHRFGLADPRVASGFRAQWKEMVYPIVTVRSQGSRLWDMDGNEYIDILNGFGPIYFGHAPDFVTEAMAKQMKDGFEIGPQTMLAGQVADLIRQLTGNERVTFCNTGSEAVMAALRLARTVTGRSKVVLFAGSYHGAFDEVLVRGGFKGSGGSSFPIAPGIPNEMIANVAVLEYGSDEALDYIRKHARDLAAVLVEPVQSRHPALQPVEFLRELRRITTESETALIFDEVVTGFRTHPGGIQAIFNIRADLVTYGKVVGGGMPIGILAGTSKFMDALDGGMWQYGDDSFPETGVTFFAGTFVRHPLALAAAHAILLRLLSEGPDLQRLLNERTTKVVQELNEFFADRHVPTRIEHFASWFYFTFPPQEPNGSLLYYHLRAKGIHILEGFPCFLTTAHSANDLKAIVDAFKESILELQQAGFLIDTTAKVDGPRGGVEFPLQSTVNDRSKLPKQVPLTESQTEVWLSARFSDEASCAFNESFMVYLEGDLNTGALKKALQALVNRHDALRGTFNSDGTVFTIHDELDFNVPIIDLSEMDEQHQKIRLSEIIHADACTTFDLEAGPLVRAKLIRFGPESHAVHFTSHHIVCDGWSTNVLLDELGKLYATECDGVVRPLPVPMAFREYALTDVKFRQSPDHPKIESWWMEVFAQPVTPLELPTDRPRQAVKSFKGGTVRRVIDRTAYTKIRKLAAQLGCTTFATLLSGLKVFLYRITGQEDIVVGIPAAGQSAVEADSLVGHCVNFLPLRSQISGDTTVETTVKNVRTVVLDAYEHQKYTYGSLVQKLNLRRDPSRLPLTEIQFNLERVGSNLDMPGLKARVDPCPKSFVNFDLFFNAIESPDGITIDCDYNTDLFDAETIERWLGHLETLLLNMASGPEQKIAHLSILNDEERRQIDNWNSTFSDYPRNKCLHDLITEQAARTPNAVAAVCGDRQLTFAELDRESNRIAQFLRRRGVGRGERVAVCLNRSVDMLLSVIGVLKSGAAYVPLDPDFPSERIQAVLQDSGPALVVTETEVATQLDLVGEFIVRLDSAWLDIQREPADPISLPLNASDPCYVIYTSGSTGKPKGVQIPHRAVVNLLTSMAQQPGLTNSDTLVAVTTLAFDIAVLELYLPLCVGAKVVIATREVTSDGHKLLALLNSSRATILQATPVTWRLLLEAGWSGRSGLKVLCGGEALPRDLADALLERSSSVWNMYGPTETTVWSATSRVQPGNGPVTIGPPIANTTFHVFDRAGQLVPVGVFGELHIGGDGVADGYWQQPELTAQKFVAASVSGYSGARMYKTGDLVRRLSSGELEFLGRLDSQVKVRGFRIETAEVEYVLKQFSAVRDCVVIAREDSPGEKQLVAYYTCLAAPPAASELRRFISTKLPAYMVPSLFVALEALPQTPNGKIDRARLPGPNEAAVGRNREITSPRNPRDQKLVEICSAVLKLRQVGIQDDLFDLGMNSLQMFQILARATDANLSVTPRQVWSGRTIAAISDQLDRNGSMPQNGESPKLDSLSRDKYRLRRSQLSGVTEAHG